MVRLLPLFLFFSLPLCGLKYEEKASVLYDSLNNKSLSELFSFYSLYKNTAQGEKSLLRALYLINKHRSFPITSSLNLFLPEIQLEPIIAITTKQAYQEFNELSEEQVKVIDYITNHLSHRKLAGHSTWTVKEMEALPVHEIDLARAILLHQFGEGNRHKVTSYEAYLDIMALQILAYLPKSPSPKEVMEAINHFIFHEMKYRFPPHSMWAKDVDLYTFLPSVLDSRHGVCLGVSILYLSIAQRLNLPLEIVTPPGHIYLRYRDGNSHINIETTARGINMPDETYLGINTKSLKIRNIKEVIGLNFINAAATAWQKGDHEKAVEFYELAIPYLGQDPLINTFLGYNYLFVGKIEEGRKLLEYAKKHPPQDIVYFDTTIEDYLDGHITSEGISTIYSEVDETRDSILKKQETLKTLVENYPKFREGWFHLAVTYLQLGRKKEAFSLLQKYHELDNNNPTVEYYLAYLSLERLCYKDAYRHFTQCMSILKGKGHNPKALKQLKDGLKVHGVFFS